MELLYTNYNNVFITIKSKNHNLQNNKYAILDNTKKWLSKRSFLLIIIIDKFTILDIGKWWLAKLSFLHIIITDKFIILDNSIIFKT